MFATISLFDKKVKIISNITKEILTQILRKNKIFFFSFLSLYRGIAKGHIVAAALQVTGWSIRQKLHTILTLRHSELQKRNSVSYWIKTKELS